MRDKEIKERLIKLFVSEFNIEDHVNLDNTNQQSFEFQTGFEFKKVDSIDQKEIELDAYISVVGNIYIQKGEEFFHDPVGYGPAENQSDPNTILDWDFGEVECFVDNANAKFTITISDLNNALNQKEAA